MNTKPHLPMQCTEFLDRYSDYDDSLLPASELARFRAHLAGCGSCARYDRVLRKGRMLARQVAAAPSPDFMPRLRHRLLTEPAPRPAPLSPVAAGGFLTMALAALAGMWAVDASWGGPLEELAGPASLPRTAQVGPPDWTSGGVALRSASTYSPLVIGPPAYGAAPRSVDTGLTSSTRHSLD